MRDAFKNFPIAAAHSRTAASDVLTYAPGCGACVIRGFRGGVHTIDLTAFGFAGTGELLARAAECKGTVTFDLGQGDALTVENAYLAQFDASDFTL